MPSFGRFITLEGGEGAGKSTQAGMLMRWLRDRTDIPVLVTREPGGDSGGEAIRRLLVEGEPGRWSPMTEALLHSAARAEHLERRIRPSLARGEWVICDRFTDSTLAYQGYGHGLSLEWLRNLNDLVTGDLAPDLTVMFDLPVAAGLGRAEQRIRPGSMSAGSTGSDGATSSKETRYERMPGDFHERVRQGFLAIAMQEPERCVILDASLPVDAVFDALTEAVAARFGLEAGGGD